MEIIRHSAASDTPDNVKLLVEQGVDLNARIIYGSNATEEALISCRGIDIGKCALSC